MTQQTTDNEPIRPVSNSEIQSFKRCKREWYLGSYLGLKPRRYKAVGPAQLGTRVHEALGAYYSPLPEHEPYKDAASTLAFYDERTAAEKPLVVGTPKEAEWLSETSLGRIMIEGYFEWLAEEGADTTLEIVAAEEQVSVPLLFGDEPVYSVAPDLTLIPAPADQAPRADPGVRLRVHLVATLDIRVKDLVSGRRAFLDTKTQANLTDLPKQSDIDEQFLFYVLISLMLSKQRGEGPEEATMGGIYNILRKVRRTAKAKPPFYGRFPVHYNIEQIRQFWIQMAGALSDMLRVEARLAAGEDPTAVCYPTPSRYCDWGCDFRGLCPMMTDPRSDAAGMMAGEFYAGDAYERYDIVTFPQPEPTTDGPSPVHGQETTEALT